MKKSLKQIKYLIAAFVIPVLVVMIAFGFRGIAPLGNHNLLVSDLATQYLPFFEFLRTQLVNHTFSTYSFMLSLGDNAIPVYTYYLMSPLNLLAIFMNAENVPLLMEAIIVIKIGLIGLAMAWFLQVKYHRQDIVQVIAAVAYGLCGFVAMYFYDFMWLEALIVLPLLTLGLERLFYQGKWGGYVVALTGMIFLNYYMGYMMCLYSVIYFVYLVFLNRKPGVKFFQYLKTRKTMTIKYMTSSVLAALLACFMLIPTIVGMLSTGKSTIKLASFLPIPRFLPSAFASLGVGVTNFVGRLNHEPSMFIGSFFAIGLFSFWFSKQVKRQEKRASFWLVGAIFLGMLIATTDTIWHMFQIPAGFPFREVYMLSFVAIMFGYEAYLKNALQDNQVVLKAGLTLAALISIGYGSVVIERLAAKRYHFETPQYIVSYWYLILALVFVILITVSLWLVNHFGKKVWWLVLILVAAEMGTNMFLALGGTHEYGDQTKFNQAFKQSQKLIKATTEKRTSFGREKVNNQLYSDSFNITYNQYNDSLLYNFTGVNSYTSSLNANTHDALAKLGLYSRNERRISSNGSMPITEQLLGIDKFITIDKNGQLTTETNELNTGLGYAVSSQIKTLKYDSEAIFQNLNQLVQKETNSKENYVVENKINHVNVHQNQGYCYEVTMTPKISGIQYMDLSTTSPNQELHVQVNGKKLKTPYHQLGAEVIELGNFKKGEQLTVSFTSNSRILEMEPHFAGFADQKFNQYLKEKVPYRLQVDNPEKLKLQGADFTGKVTTTKERDLVLISIPFDKGWSVAENGQKVKTMKVANGLTGVKLKPGTHQLEFHYEVPGMKLGLILSGLGVIGIIAQVVYFRRKQH
ncbi:YfhO family protein [Fructilactobacillus vespulae]|uniref:YfhO family protein n=1 Tax=Fructilactobacillus vespulae TaxID=1249630 RepID=UPI0039B55B43